MATIKDFEELELWQLARQFNIDLLPVLKDLERSRRFELVRQLERSAGSVMDNIAEGFERNGNKELIFFLSISKGSIGEVRSQLYRARDFELLAEDVFQKLVSDCKKITNMTGGFITYLRNCEMRGKKFKRSSETKSRIQNSE